MVLKENQKDRILGLEYRRKQFLINKYLNLYKNGQCSIDKAANNIGITVNEMMQEATKFGIKSTETIEEYKRGLELLK